MGLPWKKNPSVAPDPAALSTAPELDPEKEAIDHAETLGAPNPYYVDPAVERRVVRKLDQRLIPLVMGLCK